MADPEHPLTLEQLAVVARDRIEVDDARGRVAVRFTPTVAHCSMATLIGLCLATTLAGALPVRRMMRAHEFFRRRGCVCGGGDA